MQASTERKLKDGLHTLGLPLEERQVRHLLQHLSLLEKWNRVHNLTAIRQIDDMVSRHVLDSLAVLGALQASRGDRPTTLADVGTGAGFPGFPLAIARPDWHVTLIDSNQKKAGFLRHVLHVLHLDNVEVAASRVEDINTTFDVVISRAFASLQDMIHLTAKLCRDNTEIWAMKGRCPDEELSELPKPYIVAGIFPLSVPGSDGERHLLKIIKSPV